MTAANTDNLPAGIAGLRVLFWDELVDRHGTNCAGEQGVGDSIAS